jgi:hypothetical protein
MKRVAAKPRTRASKSEFDVARYEWLSSQEAWHERRATMQPRWHRAQARWYGAQIRSMPGLFSYIISKTMSEHAGRLAANIAANNALISRFKAIS